MTHKDLQNRIGELEIYRHLTEEIPLFIVTYLPDLKITYVNRTYCNAVNKTAEELIGTSFLSLVPKQAHEAVTTSLKSLTKGSAVQTQEYEVVTPEGDKAWQRWTNYVIFNSRGEAVIYYSIGDNITIRKEAESAVINVNNLLGDVERIAHLGVWVWNIEENSEWWSDEQYRIFGYEPGEIEPSYNTFSKALHPEDKDKVFQAVQETLENDDVFDVDYRIIQAGGDTRYIHAQGKVERSKSGVPLVMTGTVLDITERKSTEIALIASEERFRSIFSGSVDGIGFIDQDGRYSICNDSLLKMLGYSAQEVKAVSPEVLTPEKWLEMEKETILPQLQSAGYTETYEKEYIRKDGTLFPVEITSYAYDNQVFNVVRDITEKRKLEEAFLQSSKMEAIGLLAGGVAHDFNNMLAAIMSATELLGPYLPDESEEPKARKMHQMILDASSRAADLTKQLLAFSRQADKASTVINVNDIIDETLVILKSSIDRRITLDMNLLATRDTIVGDSSLLQNSLLNLCINASHAMPEGGLLKISTHEVDIDDFFCQSSSFALEPGKYIELEVRDSGCGIPREKLARIFEPFFTTKEAGAGTGLGLSTVYGTVQQHKGAIDVYSEVGEGTVFKILLPLSFRGGDLAKDAIEVPYGTGCILVVDDEDIMRFTAKEILEKYGYTVILAENGKEAVEQFCKNESMIDLVLLDMIMPVMNGRDCFKQLKRIDPQVKVVLSSGFLREEDFQEMMQDGLSGFIRKPYLTSALCCTIHDTLN